MEKIKLSAKQKEIVWLMQNGFPMMMGVDDFSGKHYYMIASTHNNGFSNTYFNATVLGNLLDKKLIYQELSHPFEWILTELGESIVFKKPPIDIS